MSYDLIIAIIVGIITGAGICYGIAKQKLGDVEVAPKMALTYMIFGGIFGGGMAYMGVPVTTETMLAEIGIYGIVLTGVDYLLGRFVFKSPTASLVVRYTGHNYFPEFILELKDGTTQKFNNSLTGICCSIWVVMPGKVAQFVMPRLAAWYPGFTVTPAFLQGTSPYKFALNVVTGMDSDGTPLKQMKIDWKDGSPVEIVPLALNKDGNPAATVGHTYVFNGN